jgi:hypothetical protein
MTRSISLLLSRTGGPPFQGSVGYVNDAIAPLLTRAGWAVRAFAPPRPQGTQESMLPFGLAASHAAHDAQGPAHVALYDAAGTAIRTPSRDWARRHVVLYHGLAYGTGTWLTNPMVDLHCANSPYLARVLRALLGFPDWRRRRCLNPRAFGGVTDVRLPVPCVDEPDGSAGMMQGVDLPPAFERMLHGATVFGHALQPGKQDWLPTLSIVYWINELARAAGGAPVKLLVAEASLTPDVRQWIDALLAPSGRRCEEFFVPVPHLNQPALFRLMRACRFALAYNRFPEPFGFYVLESVHNGCPVYTNGVGNNRFLLPPGHGIVVEETAAMAGTPDAPATPEVYRGVAERIARDLAHGGAMREACARGAAVIDATWSRAAFERSLVAALDRVHDGDAAEPEFETLEIALSPLVRLLDLDTGRHLNDYASGVLGPETIAVVRDLLGRRCAELESARMERLEREHGLFRNGILSLHPPG